MEKKELKELLNGIIGKAPLDEDEDEIRKEVEEKVRSEFEEKYKGKIAYLSEKASSNKELLKYYMDKCKRLEKEKPLWGENDAVRYREQCVKLRLENERLRKIINILKGE